MKTFFTASVKSSGTKKDTDRTHYASKRIMRPVPVLTIDERKIFVLVRPMRIMRFE